MTDNLAHLLQQRIDAGLLEMVQEVGQASAGSGLPLYLVGGAVRDLLLERPVLDIDLVVEGDAVELANHLSRASGDKVVVHNRFGTASLRRGSRRLDLATARSETYARPGALPTVKAGAIADDLRRRDFSINAMAINLSPARYGELLDPYGGEGDVADRLIRILHPGSFIDDATRMLRALRYEQRLGFHLEDTTEKQLRQDLAMLDTISADRLRREIELILKEKRPELVFGRGEELGVLQKLYPGLRGNGWLAEKFEQARQTVTRPSVVVYLSLLLYPLAPKKVERFVQHFKLPRVTAQTLRDVARLKQKLVELARPELMTSEVYYILEGASLDAITALSLACDEMLVKERLSLFTDKLRYVKPILNGDDLMGLGVPAGPQLRQMLQELKEAKLDDKTKSREEEEALVKQWLETSTSDSPGSITQRGPKNS